jgi:hypothetical protein
VPSAKISGLPIEPHTLVAALCLRLAVCSRVLLSLPTNYLQVPPPSEEATTQAIRVMGRISLNRPAPIQGPERAVLMYEGPASDLLLLPWPRLRVSRALPLLFWVKCVLAVGGCGLDERVPPLAVPRTRCSLVRACSALHSPRPCCSVYARGPIGSANQRGRALPRKSRGQTNNGPRRQRGTTKRRPAPTAKVRKNEISENRRRGKTSYFLRKQREALRAFSENRGGPIASCVRFGQAITI